MPRNYPAHLKFFRSEFSKSNNDCVEVAFDEDTTYVRDSKNPEGGALRLSEREFARLKAVADQLRPPQP